MTTPTTAVERLKVVYAVITQIPEFPSMGNHSDDLILYDKHLKSWVIHDGRGESFDKNTPYRWVKVPVFQVGEIIVLHDNEYGREVGGHQRKPSKWSVEYECFTSIKKAIARSIEVTQADLDQAIDKLILLTKETK